VKPKAKCLKQKTSTTLIEYSIKIKREVKNLITDPWVWRMAWRDARHNYSRLFLFMASLITGIAAVVALDSLNNSLQGDIERNAKELLGADLVLNSTKKFEGEIVQAIDSNFSLAGEAELSSMVLFKNTGYTRLIRLVALQGDFPFYGDLLTRPENAYEQMKTGKFAIMDDALASQYEVSSGDTIKIGNTYFPVAGVVTKIPGGGGLAATLAPSVYISLGELDSTGLVQYGSRINYSMYIRTNTEEETAQLIKTVEPLSKKHGYSYETVQARKEGLGRGFSSVYRFFSLLAFVALILGCIGVASAVHIYAREKRDEVAVLRCIGSSGWQAFAIYFIQIFILGVIGSAIGSLAGIGIQQLIPILFKGYLPMEVSFSVSWTSLLMGFIIGTIVSVLFSMLPLVAIRFVPPLTVLRADSQATRTWSKTRMLAILLIILFPLSFAAYQTKSWLTGALFFAGLALALAALSGVAWLLLKTVRKFFPSRASFVWRHALANLFRPNNQTQMLMVSIGLGAFIIATLNTVEQSMLSQVEFAGNENQSNTIMFDIQPPQKEGVIKLMEENKLPVNQVVPIITCRLSELKGKSVESLQNDTTDSVSNWALTREYRVTYRDSLHKSEELIEGDLHKRIAGKDSVWVTISEGMHENLNVKIGDSLVFDIQGVPLKVRIAGIRKVEWSEDPPNFIFVFPSGVLENAPQIFVTTTRIDDQQAANRFQQQLVMSYPNVSLIDLRLILTTVQELFNKLGLVIRFLALFSIVTGLVVLAGAIINSKFARIKENVLLRTVGAQSRHITQITLIEYAYLGLFAALTGVILSVGGSWLLTTYFFEITFAVDVIELVWIVAGIVSLTMLLGWLNLRDIVRTPPLQVLRKET
jgi:putative ABC transport system permease protein